VNFDLTSLLAGISFTAIAGWLGSFFALRKDERAVQVDQITKERTKWRDNMRKLTEDIVLAYYFEHNVTPVPRQISVLRARLTTSINLKDDEHDKAILAHFDDLFAAKSTDIDTFTKRIALLLKHDWERVKWDCTPIYVKVRLFLVPATMRLLGRANWWPGGRKQPPGSDDARPPKPKDPDLVRRVADHTNVDRSRHPHEQDSLHPATRHGEPKEKVEEPASP